MKRFVILLIAITALSSCAPSPSDKTLNGSGTLNATVSGGAADDATNIRAKATTLLRQVIAPPAGSTRLPEFLTWSTRADMSFCSQPDQPAPASGVRIDPSLNMHGDFEKLFSDTTAGDFGGGGFYYDKAARDRLCGHAVLSDTASPIVRSGAVGKWWTDNGQMPDRIDGFAAGSRVAAAMWYPIRWPKSRTPVEITIKSRSDTDTIEPRPIKLDISEALNQPPQCASPLQMPANADASVKAEATLESFYWIQFTETDLPAGNCGTIFVLLGFHAIEKQAKPDDRWLWTTFWWDDKATSKFSTADGKPIEGAGPHPEAWKNYAMDVAFGADRIIFNPNREKQTSNCEYCHRHAVFPIDREAHDIQVPAPVPTPSLSFDFVFGASLIQRSN